MKYVNPTKFGLLLAAAVFFVFSSKAQLYHCNVFLQGSHIEVGINFNGAYGSSVTTDTGLYGYCGTNYHPNGNALGTVVNSGLSGCISNTCGTGMYGLGFISDPDKDGWNVGVPWKLVGDYFLPGYPQEGWAIRADNKQVENFNGPSGCPSTPASIYGTGNGANLAYIEDGKYVQGIWQGVWDSMRITQRTLVDTTKVFFTVYMTIENIAKATTRTKVFYERTLDPDNTAVDSTNHYDTWNQITYQLPNPDGKVLVSAIGLLGNYPTVVKNSQAYLGLGTLDCRAKVWIVRGGLTPSYADPGLDSIYSLWAGTSSIGGGDTVNYIMLPKDTNQTDCGVGMVFKLGDITPGDSVNFAFAYILRIQDIDSAFASTTPRWKPVTAGDSSTHLSGDLVDVCAGAFVPLKIVNGGGFIWHWMSPTGNELTDTVGPSTKVKIDTSTTTVYAIGTNPACGTDTQVIVLRPFTPPPPVVTSNTPLCLGDTLKLNAYGIPNSYFRWKGPNGFASTAYNPKKLNVQTPDSGLYTLLDSIPGCPPQVVTTSVLVNAVVAKIGAYKPAACVGADFKVYFDGRAGDIGSHYKWTFQDAVPKEGTDTIKGPYTLRWDTVSVTDKVVSLRVQNDKCVSTDTRLVPVVAAPAVDFSVPLEACQNAATPIKVADYSLEGADSMAWDFDGGKDLSGSKPGEVLSDLKVKFTTPGPKAIKLTIDYWRCTAAPDTEYLTVYPSPDAHINKPDTVCEGDTVMIKANAYNDYKYSWSPIRLVDTTKTAANYAVFTIPSAQNNRVYLSVKDMHNCISTDTLAVDTKLCCTVSFPSAFTPNGDGRNDIFKPITQGHHHIKHYKIVNRYGQVVFESNVETVGWDGTLHGVPQDIGTYFYVFTYDCNGKEMESKGDVTLIK